MQPFSEDALRMLKVRSLKPKRNNLHYSYFIIIIFGDLITGYPNQCYLEFEKKGYAVGEHTPIGNCMKIFCAKDLSYVVHTYVKH